MTDAFQNILKFTESLRVRDVRTIFSIMRNNVDDIGVNSFFPKYGLTVGEFSTAYVLNQNHYKRKVSK